MKLKRVLFLCVANSARSQMAEGLAKKLISDMCEVYSAGSAPSGVVHPMAISVMMEIGIDISIQKSKSIDDLDPSILNHLNFIITLCEEEACPAFLIKKAPVLRWAMPDPASTDSSEIEQAFRNIRDIISEKINDFRSLLLNTNRTIS